MTRVTCQHCQLGYQALLKSNYINQVKVASLALGDSTALGYYTLSDDYISNIRDNDNY